MARRAPYTKVEKDGQHRPPHVRGKGDIVFRGFQCLQSNCVEFIVIPESQLGPDFEISCPACNYSHTAGGEVKFFDYRLVHRNDRRMIEEGEFVVLHDDYIRESQRFKYCLLCYALKPLDLFGVHNARRSGRQGECRLCKTIYNGIKNQSRITDQHREAAQRRRLYKRLAGETGRVDSREIFEKFGGHCFNCNRQLFYTPAGQQEINLDHTLPIRLLWPIHTDNATLLCSNCNNQKHDLWPSEFYSIPKLRSLARLTGYPYDLVSGQPRVNEEAVAEILADADSFIEEWIHRPDEIRKVRRMIRGHTEVDIFEYATHVPAHLLDPEEPAAAAPDS